jgi:hypothetical protein
MVSETTTTALVGRTQQTTALEQSALLEALEALKATTGADPIRSPATTISRRRWRPG